MKKNANILWNSYKDRLGTSAFTHMFFNLNELLQREDGLQYLVNPFTHEEINGIVMGLPSGKSPGPDVFNTDFMKKYWRVISRDFYNMFLGFYNGNICTQRINGSYTTLVPKWIIPTM
jgi:hypothetical protein